MSCKKLNLQIVIMMSIVYIFGLLVNWNNSWHLCCSLVGWCIPPGHWIVLTWVMNKPGFSNSRYKHVNKLPTRGDHPSSFHRHLIGHYLGLGATGNPNRRDVQDIQRWSLRSGVDGMQRLFSSDWLNVFKAVRTKCAPFPHWLNETQKFQKRFDLPNVLNQDR